MALTTAPGVRKTCIWVNMFCGDENCDVNTGQYNKGTEASHQREGDNCPLMPTPAPQIRSAAIFDEQNELTRACSVGKIANLFT